MTTLPIQASLDAGTVLLEIDIDRDGTVDVTMPITQDEARGAAVRLRALANHSVGVGGAA